MKNATEMVRQGDVLLVRRSDVNEKDLTPAPKDARGVVLAEGESSGHHHQVFGRGAKLMHFRDASAIARVLVVPRTAELRVVGGGSGGVDRHTPIKLSPGTWEVRTQRAYSVEDDLRSRAVAD